MNSHVMLKILMVGDSGVGKSSLITRYVSDDFCETAYATIGVDFKKKTVRVNDTVVTLFLWDTAGQERFRTLTSSYYRGCQGVVLVYDCQVKSSFEGLDFWIREVNKYCSIPDTVKLLIANKIDKGDPSVSAAEGRQFAKENNLIFLETSAKSRDGVEEAFKALVLKILENPSLSLRGAANAGYSNEVGLGFSTRQKRVDSTYRSCFC